MALQAERPRRLRITSYNVCYTKLLRTHQVPQVGFPHSEPVQSARKVNSAPVGAIALAIMPERRVLKVRPRAAQKAITKYKNIDIHAAGTVITSYSIHYTKLYERNDIVEAFDFNADGTWLLVKRNSDGLMGWCSITYLVRINPTPSSYNFV